MERPYATEPIRWSNPGDRYQMCENRRLNCSNRHSESEMSVFQGDYCTQLKKSLSLRFHAAIDDFIQFINLVLRIDISWNTGK